MNLEEYLIASMFTALFIAILILMDQLRAKGRKGFIYIEIPEQVDSCMNYSNEETEKLIHQLRQKFEADLDDKVLIVTNPNPESEVIIKRI